MATPLSWPPYHRDRNQSRSLCCISTGLIVISASTFAGLFAPKYIHNKFLDASTICDSKDSSYESWVSSLTDETPSITELFLYDINNADAFIANQTEAIIDEIGPFAFDCRSKKFEVEFVGATVEYKSYSRCEYVAESSCDDCLFSKKITNYSPGYAQILTQAVTEGNLFLKAGGCSTRQIMNIGTLATGGVPCNFNGGSPSDDDACACCVPNSPTLAANGLTGNTYAAMNLWRAGSNCVNVVTGVVELSSATCTLTQQGGQTLCIATDPTSGDLLSCTSFDPLMPLVQSPKGCEEVMSNGIVPVGTLNMLDGGISVKVGFSSSPTLDTHSSLIIEKTAGELAFGYPLVLAGYLAAGQVAETTISAVTEGVIAALTAQFTPIRTAQVLADDSIPAEEQAARIQTLVGQDVAQNAPDAIGQQVPAALQGALHTYDMGGYTLGKLTDDVWKVCEANCAYNAQNPAMSGCGGNAPKHADAKYQYLEGIDCKPLTFAYQMSYACAASASDPNTKCRCSNGSDSQPGTACCLSFGYTESHAAVGRGCLAWSPGWLTPDINIWDDETAIANQNEPSYKRNTGCDVDHPQKIDDILTYNGITEKPVWMKPFVTVLPSPTDVATFKALSDPDDPNYDAQVAAVLLKKGKVGGKGGTKVMADGLDTRQWASKTFNDGKEPSAILDDGDEFKVFFPHLFAEVDFPHLGSVTTKNIKMHRYGVTHGLLEDNDGNNAVGIGVGGSGISIQTYKFGAPVALSLPNFLHGDESLFSGGDKFKLYKNYDYETRKKLDANVLLDQTYVSENEQDYSTYLDIEPSTGATMNGRQRLGVNLYGYECPVNANITANDPRRADTTNLACSLFFQNNAAIQKLNYVNGRDESAACRKFPSGGFACSTANILTPLAPANTFVPNFWMNIAATIDDDNANTFVTYGTTMQLVDIGSLIVGAIGITMSMYGLLCLVNARK